MGDHPCLGSPTRYAPLPSLSSPPRTAVQGLSYGPPSSGPAQMVATDTQVNQMRATLPSVAVLSPLGAGKLCSPFGGQHQLRPHTLTFTGQSRARFQQTRSLALSTGVFQLFTQKKLWLRQVWQGLLDPNPESATPQLGDFGKQQLPGALRLRVRICTVDGTSPNPVTLRAT